MERIIVQFASADESFMEMAFLVADLVVGSEELVRHGHTRCVVGERFVREVGNHRQLVDIAFQTVLQDLYPALVHRLLKILAVAVIVELEDAMLFE